VHQTGEFNAFVPQPASGKLILDLTTGEVRFAVFPAFVAVTGRRKLLSSNQSLKEPLGLMFPGRSRETSTQT
jgi:hypothetical protein